MLDLSEMVLLFKKAVNGQKYERALDLGKQIQDRLAELIEQQKENGKR
jgi:hypothetical protein